MEKKSNPERRDMKTKTILVETTNAPRGRLSPPPRAVPKPMDLAVCNARPPTDSVGLMSAQSPKVSPPAQDTLHKEDERRQRGKGFIYPPDAGCRALAPSLDQPMTWKMRRAKALDHTESARYSSLLSVPKRVRWSRTLCDLAAGTRAPQVYLSWPSPLKPRTFFRYRDLPFVGSLT
jgi:hypothetical protein